MATTTRFVVKNGLDNNSKTLLNIGSSGSELSFSGGHPVTFTSTGTSTLTLPTSGTLAITTDIKDASLTLAVSGVGLGGSASFSANATTSATFTVTSNATSANTVNTMVSRDTSGNFSAGTITASLSGNATNVTGVVAIANGGTNATTAAEALTNLGATTVGSNLFKLTDPGSTSFIRINSANTITTRSASDFRTDLGANAVGSAIFTLSNPGSTSFIKINSDNTVSAQSASSYRSDLGANTVGSNIFTLTNPSATTFIRINSDNTVSTRSASEMRTDLGATSLGSDFFTLSTSSTSYIQITAAGAINLLSAANFRTAIGAGTGNGTVTSVDLSMPNIFSVSNNPVTSSGTLTVSLATQNANTVFAGPSTGVAAAPTFRSLTFTDITGDPLVVSKGGTGTSSLTDKAVLVGAGTSSVTLTSTSSQYKVFVSGSGGTPTWGTVSLDQAAAISGKLPIASGGTNATTSAEALTNLGALSSASTSTQDAYFNSIYLLESDTNPTRRYLQIINNDNLSAARVLNISTNDADRTLTISANASISGTNTGDQTITLTGDVTGSGTGSFAATLSTSGVTAGTYNNSTTAITPFTVDSKGRITGTGAASTISPAFSNITSKPTTLSGYGITDALSNSTSSTQNAYFGNIYLQDDTTPSHYLQITDAENLTADRILNLNVNDANRTISLSGNLTVSSAATISGTNSGDQTITLTGDVSGSGTGSFAATIGNQAVTFGKIVNSGTTGLSVVGRSTNSAGSFDEISAASDHQILRRSGTSVAFGSINLASSNAVGTSILPTGNGGIGTTSAAANTVFSGPTTGSATTPAFRSLVAADIPSLDANKITTGTVATARLATGTASASTYLRGDQTWASVSGGSPAGNGGSLQYNNAGSFGGAAYAQWNSTNNSLWLYATPTSTTLSAVLQMGAGFTDEVPAIGDFAGSANGTILASNIGTSFTGNQVDFQVAGSNIFKIDSSGNTTIAATTQSTSTTTGALKVSGGVGVQKTLYVGGNLYQNSNAITAYDTGFRNRIINGDGNIDQRNSGTDTTPGVGAINFIDRWKMNVFGSGRLTIGQNYGGVTPPDGFVSYIGMKTTTTSTPAANDYNFLTQMIEGSNLIDLQFGTANAKSITISFWAYSSLTGTFGGSIRNSSANRSYPFTYTISSSNTWEKKTVVIPGDTTGTWSTSHLGGLEIIFVISNGTTWQATPFAWVGANATGPSGSLVNLIGTLNATLYLTGIQVEIGSVATPYERRNYGHEFALCQRYYQITEVRTGGYHTTGGEFRGSGYLGAAMRPISSPVLTVLATDESANLGTLNVNDSFFRGDSFRYIVSVTSTGTAYGQWKVSCDTEF